MKAKTLIGVAAFSVGMAWLVGEALFYLFSKANGMWP